MKCCCVCSSTDTHFKRLTTNVIHPPGHVLQLNVSKGFVALRSNICQNTSFFSFLTSFKPKLLCLSLFLPVHCFMCQHTDTHTHKASFPFQNQKAIIFHSVRLSPRQATVLRLSTMHEQSCMTFRLFVILSFRIYFDDLKSRTSLEHVDRRQLPTAFVLVRFGVLPIFFSAPSIALIG